MMKTNDYSLFKFRGDNREKIERTHIDRLKESIKSRNMLELRPIVVNQEMEIIDGQHRLIAAKELGVDIYYQVKEDFKAEDIILMNISKTWGVGDYLNYYCQNGHEEYLKLREFIKEKGITLRVALVITMGKSKNRMTEFKHGQYQFIAKEFGDTFDICWDTIHYIKKMQNVQYVHSGKFWKALIIIINSPEFDREKWMENLKKMIDRVGPRVTTQEYVKMLADIHNWRSHSKIWLHDEA